MDPIRNPYAPGAGAPPPELAGRDALRETVRIALERVRQGRAARSVLLVGLRGVGKTVLLDRMREDADAAGIHTVSVEAPEHRSLPALLAPALRAALLRLSRAEQAREAAQRALRALAGFVAALKVKYRDIEVAVDLEPEPGLADSGDLENDLVALLEAVGVAAQRAGTALALFVDELQYVDEEQLASLITALHRCAQRQLPVILVGAGLPQLRGHMGRAKSYAERLFEFPEVGSLARADAERAIAKPAADQGVEITREALDAICERTIGYPYFLQEWGKHAWDAADASPIDLDDVERGSVTALAALDDSFFRVRLDRVAPSERRYLRAMAELGPGMQSVGDVAVVLDRPAPSLAPIRASLIAKGMIYSPEHGDVAFTVPLFDAFLRRAMPGDDWKRA